MIEFDTVVNGSEGRSVCILQAMLRGMQYTGADGKPIDIDGHAGTNTVFAIDTFQTVQRAYGYECGTNGRNDHKFGPACWRRLLGV